MDVKRFILAAVGAFALIVFCDVLIHHVWLGEVYRANAQWWRPADEMRAMVGLMYLSEALLALLLTFIYTKGYEGGKGRLGQGFRFGVLMGLLLALPSSLMKAFVYPYPADLILAWMVGTLAEMTLAGLMIGYIYKPAE
jgi:hypothetical protein